MFSFFRRNKKEVKQEEVLPVEPTLEKNVENQEYDDDNEDWDDDDEDYDDEEEVELKDNEIALSSDEISEIDGLINSVKIAIEELEEKYRDLQGDSMSVKVIEKFNANYDDEGNEISEDAQESLEFIRDNLDGMMKNFVDFRLNKLKEKIDLFKRRLAIWENFRAKIGSKLKLEVNEIELPEDSLPLVVFLNKIVKTLISNPNLLNDDQDAKFRSSVNEIMKQAFNS